MVPDGPTEDMLAILGCQNGAQVDQYLKQVLVGHNVCIEPGLCSAINKGIFVHADDGSMPRHFSCFLTPPMKDDTGIEESNSILRLQQFNEDVEISSSDELIVVSFQFFNKSVNQLCTTVKMNGGDDYSILIDTGSTFSVIEISKMLVNVRKSKNA